MTQPESTSPLPLAGLTVVELHAIGPVPFAGLQLRQLGATVTRVCPPIDRGIGLSVQAEFDLLNAGKTVRSIDLKSADGMAEMQGLLSESDVLLEGFRPGVLERLELGPDVLATQHPLIVLGRLSGYGSDGPLASRAGHDINYLAMSGVLHAIGNEESPAIPLNLIGDFGGGAMHLLLGVLAKLVQRGITGRGGVAETSILAGTIGLTPMIYAQLGSERWNLQRQNNWLDGGVPFYRVYKTQDEKFVAVGALEKKFFVELLKLTETDATIDADRQYDPDTWKNMILQFAAVFRQRKRDEWAQAAIHFDCCVSPVLDFTEACYTEHNCANEWYTNSPCDHPTTMINFT